MHEQRADVGDICGLERSQDPRTRHVRYAPLASFCSARERGEILAVDLTPADWTRLSEVMEEYPELGFIDASVVSVAERLTIKSLVTTDRRHFGMVRPRHVKAFGLLP